MLFPTTDFAIFFGIVFLGNWLLRPFATPWKLFILAASYVFYSWWDWRFVFLLAASTLCTVTGGFLVDRSATERGRRASLVATLVAELGLLGWFKYYGFFSISIDNGLHKLGFHGTPVPLLAITLPVGISFFTFMGLSYVFDIYRRRLRRARFLDVAVFVAFFPHLVAGPIVRGADLLPQVERAERRDPRQLEFPEAAYLIFGGLFKKVVISSYVSSAIVTPVYNNPSLHSAPEILLATYGFAVQIYCDFSGYTDIAIGCALLLGFRFPQNFNAPYTATSLQDFWRRWHMTLSSWLRDYLYIPLGGNRGSRSQMYRNIMITMLLGGLWHGAAWTFVIWGGIHGLGQSVGHFKRSRREARRAATAAERPVRRRLATLRDLPGRLFRLDLFPGEHVQRCDDAHRSALHDLGPGGSLGAVARRRGRRRRAGDAVPAAGPPAALPRKPSPTSVWSRRAPSSPRACSSSRRSAPRASRRSSTTASRRRGGNVQCKSLSN